MNGKNNTQNLFPERLRTRRKALGIKSCERLWALIYPDLMVTENSRRKIENWESGKAEPTISEFKKLCEVLECDPEYLWGSIDSPKRDTQTIMDITGLEEEAVDMMIKIAKEASEHLGLDKRQAFISPVHVLSTMLSAPDFYGAVIDINACVHMHGRSLVSAKGQNVALNRDDKALVDEFTNIRSENMSLLNELAEKYGYMVIGMSDMHDVLEYRLHHHLSKVCAEVTQVLCSELDDYLLPMLQRITAQYVQKGVEPNGKHPKD